MGEDECRILYVAQKEWTVIDPSDMAGVEYIASDEATSCIIVAVRAARGGVIGMVHLDTLASIGGLSDMVDRVRLMARTIDSAGSAVGNFDVMIVGEGHNVGATIIEYFMRQKDTFRLMLFNPLCRGIAVAVRDGAIYECRVPPEAKVDHPLRMARAMATVECTELRFSTSPDALTVTIEPFAFQAMPGLSSMASMPDEELLQRFSTTPTQEGEDFLPAIRAALALLTESSSETLFSTPRILPVPRARLLPPSKSPGHVPVFSLQSIHTESGDVRR